MNILKITLLGNALFSFLTGLYLIFYKNTVANWFETDNSIIFLCIGIGLIYFSFTIFKELKNPNPLAVLFIIVQDLIWIIASIVILWIKPFGISVFGNQMIIVVGLIVLFFSIGQSFGLAQVDSIGSKGMKQLTLQRIVKASKENAWKAVSDVSNYHEVAPNIDTVTIISGEGSGMVRSCTHKNEQWKEVATFWEEGERYSFEVETNAADYPYPFSFMKGTWAVEEVSSDQTKITMIFDLKYKRKIHNLILHPLLKKKFGRVCFELLDNWEKMLEG